MDEKNGMSWHKKPYIMTGRESLADLPLRCAAARGTTNLRIWLAPPGTTTIRTIGTTTSVFELFAPIMPNQHRSALIMMPVFHGIPDRGWA